MTWYGIIPLEHSLAAGGDGQEAIARSNEIRIGDVLMEVEPVGDDLARIVRLLDCRLEHYLDPQYAPGRIIRYIPTLEAAQNEA